MPVRSYAAEGPLDRLAESYGTYLSCEDPFGFPIKVDSAGRDVHALWRGGKVLFYQWCREHADRWLSDREAYLVQHGDVHFGNIGTYASRGRLGRVAFGLVDFDDSFHGPFQYELLQGVINLRLLAEQNGIDVDDAGWRRIVRRMVDAYAAGATSDRNARRLLRRNPTVRDMMIGAEDADYEDELKQVTDGAGRFVRTLGSKRTLKSILLPVEQPRREELAVGLAEAIARDPQIRKVFRYHDADAVRQNMLDVVQRIHLTSSGSQGLKKYMVLMRRPLKETKRDVVLYLKQEIPSSAERAGLVAADPRPAGRRCAEDADVLTSPGRYICGWFEVGGESYWLSLREPWGAELDPADVREIDGLEAYADIWGTVAGTTHRGQGEMIEPRLTEALRDELLTLSAAYIRQLKIDHEALSRDERVKAYRLQVEEAVAKYRPGPTTKPVKRNGKKRDR